MEDINLLLNYIDSEINAKKNSIFGGVDKGSILNYTSRIRESLSEALNEKRIKEDLHKAQNIVAVAEQRKEQILNENQLVVDATKRAEEIVKKAYDMQNDYATNTMKNLFKMLTDVKEHLQVATDSIDRAIKNLKE